MSSIEHDEAITLIREGFSVFPTHTARRMPDGTTLCTCGKDGCTGKHPVIQFSQKASIRRNDVDIWYRDGREPAPGIGVHLGKSHCWVLDIDGDAGMDALEKLTDKYGDLPETRTVISGSGTGRHYYFAAWVDRVNSGPLIPGKIDVKGNVGNAYVVAPPSMHHSGNRYQYLNRCAPVDAPVWLLTLVAKNTGVTTSHTSPDGLPAPTSRVHEVPVIELLQPDLIGDIRRDGNYWRGSHPTHSSTTHRNFVLNIQRNRWFCTRHQSTGGLFELAAVLSGLCDCSDFKLHSDGEVRLLPLTGRKFRQAVQFCLDRGISPEALKVHLSGGKYHV